MARLAKYTEAITYVDGTTGALMPASGATVHAYNPDTVVNISGGYTDSAGLLAASWPISLGADGMLEFYVDSESRRFDLLVADNGASAGEFSDFTLQDQCATFNKHEIYSDEFSTLQAAITALSTGEVLVINQPHTINAVLTKTGVNDIEIRGRGRGTKLTADTDLNANMLEISGCARLKISNLYFDGNSGNQSGGGPYSAITFEGGAGCSDCIIEDVYISDMKGEGLQYENTTDLCCRKVVCQTNTGYGFYHGSESANRAIRPTFIDCVSKANGTGGARLHGWYACPPPDGARYMGCKAIGEPGDGFSFLSHTDYQVDYKDNELSGCIATGNTAHGLHIRTYQSNCVMEAFKVTGGNFTANTLNGIMLEGDTVASATIISFSISGMTCLDNTQHGLEMVGSCYWGAVSGGSIADNGGDGIKLIAEVAGAGYDPSGNTINGVNVFRNTGTGVNLAALCVGNLVFGCQVDDNVAAQFADAGTQNVVFGWRPKGTGLQGGFPAFGHTTIEPLATPTAAQKDTFFFDTTCVFADAGNACSAAALCTRATTNTRVLSFTPLDTSAAATMSAQAGGWYSPPSYHTAGANLCIKFGAPLQVAASYRGIWQIMCVEPVET